MSKIFFLWTHLGELHKLNNRVKLSLIIKIAEDEQFNEAGTAFIQKG